MRRCSKMIERKRLLDLSFYEKEHFSGSDRERNLRFRLQKDGEEFLTTVWPEPLSFECTAEDKKITYRAPFSEEGLQAIVDWMNAQSFAAE